MKILKKKAKVARKPMKPLGLMSKRWWALVRGPLDLPVLFETRKQALENRDPDEYVLRVWVEDWNTEVPLDV